MKCKNEKGERDNWGKICEKVGFLKNKLDFERKKKVKSRCRIQWDGSQGVSERGGYEYYC